MSSLPVVATRRRSSTSAVALAASVLLVLLVWPSAAWAHAVLVSSDPEPGAELRQVPSVVTLAFDEPLVSSLSRATVTAPSGSTYTSSVSGRTMHVRVRGEEHGVYRVDWKTVSEVDGHTIEGAFRFGVGAAVTGAAVTAPAPTDGDVGLSVLRGLEYTLLLLACGIALLDLLARPSALRQPHVPVAAALLAAGVLVVGTEAALAGSGLSARGVTDYLGNGLTGGARVARLALETTLLTLAWWRRRLSVLLLAGVIGSVAVAGHGADVEPAWQGMAVNAAHLAAAGAWVGGILALALLRLRGTWPEAGRDALAGFSRVAPWAFAASVGLGAVQAYQLLGGPQPVLRTSYGLTLVAKSVAVAAMVPLSWLAWRRTREHLRGEAVLAVLVIAAAAALAAFPVVPKEAREAAEEAAAAASPPVVPAARPSEAFPQPGDLTMGGRAGKVMVGLSLHPARPGRNTVTVYLASPARHTTTARVEVSGRSVDLHACGTRCRRGSVRLTGRQRLSVVVSGQGTATYHVPRLPSRDAAGVVRSAAQRMDGLRSYRVAEQLAGFHTRYVYQRPHHLFVRTRFGNGLHATLWLGRRLYQRVGANHWRLQTRSEQAPVPYYPWYPFRPLVDSHVIGHARVGGRPVLVVSTFGGHGRSPESVWFTLYVDPTTSEVVESRMWAPNHFMRDRYTRIDEPVSLPVPPRRAR
jgi:methionine-rich copper-binding protein CopC/putative copper export protein